MTSLRRIDAWAAFAWTVRATWHELAPVMGISVAWALAAIPLVVALVLGEAWLAVFASLPLFVGSTALFGTLAGVAMGDAVRRPARGTFDPHLGAAAWAWTTLIVALVGLGSDVTMMAGSALGAIEILVLPLAYAYAAVRGRRGMAAVRAGGIIAILHPGLALILASILCLAMFACVASAGTLLLVAPAFVALLACRAMTLLLMDDEPTSPEG